MYYSYRILAIQFYTFFNQKFDNGENDVLSSFNMICNLAKISHLTELQTCSFNLELAIELYC